MSGRSRIVACALFVFSIAAAWPAHAQLLWQSTLTHADRDTTFRLTIEHLGEDARWLGLAARQITWAPDGRWIYFRWREDPEPGQRGDTDPWYAVNAQGTRARQVDDAEAALIPTGSIEWSRDRRTTAWANGGTLFLWTRERGTRPVHASGRTLGNVRVTPDGRQVYFATQGLGGSLEGGASEEQGDLWVYDRDAGTARQIAYAHVKDEKKKTETGTWLEQQQLELIDIVAKRKRDREIADSVRRARGPARPQAIPVEKGAVLRNLTLSPDGRFVTFRWIKNPAREHRTSYMEFVNATGYATEQRARPKVGEPLFEAKFGIVRVDPAVEPDSVQVTWADDGTDKATVVHGPWWSPAGRHAAVQILSMDHKERWIALLDVETGATTALDHQREEAWIGGPLVVGRWNPGWLEWLPDGSAFGFGSTATGWAMLYLADVASGTVRRLTDGEFEVRRAQLSPDGRTWFLTTSREHPGEEHLYHLPARGGALTRVTVDEGVHAAYPSPDGTRLAVTYETRLLMPDLYVMDNRAGAAKRQVTKSGTDAYYRIPWAPSEIVSFPDPAGLPTWGEVWAPPARPNGAAVVYVHGCGECAQAVHKRWGGRTALVATYLRQEGYLAASLDYRGSSGYGHANRTYAYRQMGVSDVDSGLPFLDLLVERYGVDRRRIGIYGGSYGGFFTIMALFRHPGRYAAGVALYPVTDWAHYNQGYTSRILNGAPYQDEDAYRRSSPVYYAAGLTDALQIQHGLVDGNVQIQDSFRLAQMLMELNKDFDLVVYPVEDHGWDEVPSRRDSYKRMMRWFERHLLGGAAGAASGR